MLTDMKLHRLDGSEMPVDENGKLTDIKDALLVLHELCKDMTKMMLSPLPMLGMTMFDLMLMGRPVEAMAYREALTIVHGASCPHKGSVEQDTPDMSQVLMNEIINILNNVGQNEFEGE